MDNTINNISISKIKIFHLVLLSGLGGIVISVFTGNLLALGVIIAFPVLLTLMILGLRQPLILFYGLFFLNYFIMGFNRYINITGISVLMDSIMFVIFLLILIHSRLFSSVDWMPLKNILTFWGIVWMVYCLGEVINPSGSLKAWILSRNLIFNGLIITILTTLLCVHFKTVKVLLFLFSVFSLLAVLKAFMQKYWGFDAGETLWLNNGGATTHLIRSGTRYFSFFTDAGNFGSNMGGSAVVLAISAFFIRNRALKIYYGIVSIGCLYAMFLSGTRGAMIVPLGGLALFTLISKNVKLMVASGCALIAIYVFFAFTTIGEGNAQIRRMRTAFRPHEDASFNVRKENQRRLASYLKYKPFGEGLGLSGVENRDISNRFTTNIPNDSWYVKVWVETGIVGVILYVGGLFIIIGKGAWILISKVRDSEVRGVLGAFLCCIFGLLLSAYGNPFWGQYPTMMIVFVGLSLVMKGEYFDREVQSEVKQVNS